MYNLGLSFTKGHPATAWITVGPANSEIQPVIPPHGDIYTQEHVPKTLQIRHLGQRSRDPQSSSTEIRCSTPPCLCYQ